MVIWRILKRKQIGSEEKECFHFKEAVIDCSIDDLCMEVSCLGKVSKRGFEWWNGDSRKLIKRKMKAYRCLLQNRLKDIQKEK